MDTVMDRKTAIRTLLALTAASTVSLPTEAAADGACDARWAEPVIAAKYGIAMRPVTEALLDGQITGEGLEEVRAMAALTERALAVMMTPAGLQHARRVGFDLNRLPMVQEALDELKAALAQLEHRT